MFLFFLLIVINVEFKRVGLIVYFFFQSIASLLLFILIIFFYWKIVFLFLIAKLGLFPFFYWVIVVSVKVGIIGNIFVLRLQKFVVFWLLWLLIEVKLDFLYFMVYRRIFFVIVNLLLVRDLWLLLVYSSIANTRIIVLRVVGSQYIVSVFLYLLVVLIIIYLIKIIDSFNELILIVFFFMVIPPFILFFIKFYVIIRVDYIMKIGLFLVFFDVIVLLYYFSLVFIKFILMERGILVYIMNILLIVRMLLLRNYVALIIIYKS